MVWDLVRFTGNLNDDVMGKFSPNKKQREAFERVERAIIAAKKTGLVFYAKSDSLVAYNKAADVYNNQVEFQKTVGTGYSQIECITEFGLINDSGADDYPCYRTEEDEKKYS